MIRNNKSRLLVFLMTTIMYLTGCGEKADCHIPNNHYHLYVDPQTKIEKYIQSEELTIGSYERQDEYIELTSIEAGVYKEISNNSLFYALNENNWKKLRELMEKNYVDHFRYFYREVKYISEEVTDSKGNTHTEYHRKVEEGWSYNPRHPHNTGLAELEHTEYISAIPQRTIIETIENGQKVYKYVYTIRFSNPNHDIRKSLMDFPFANLNCTVKRYKRYYFTPIQLRHINEADYQDVFPKPNLNNKTMYYYETTENNNYNPDNNIDKENSEPAIIAPSEDEDYTFIYTY